MAVTTARRVRLFHRGPQTEPAGQRPPSRPSTTPQPTPPVVGSPPSSRERRLGWTRRIAVTMWAAVVIYRTVTDGLAFNRELLLLYIATGLIAASIGRGHKVFAVVRDWLPLALVLVLYDFSRGAADMLGGRTLWQFQAGVDRWLFFGTVPTVWLQEHIKLAQPPWWEVIISSIYMSFFVLPYVVAGVLWLRNRTEWAAFVRRFVALSFAALVVYVVLPAAPPWAAASCTPTDVAGGPANPPCMFRGAAGVPDGGLLGAMRLSQPGCSPIRRANLHPRMGHAASPVGRGAAGLRTGQRQPGRGDSFAARRGDRDDFDLPVATGQARVASAAGGLSVGDGLRAGVLRRALRRRHPAGLGACRGGVRGDGAARLLVVAPSRVEITRRCLGSASGRSWSRTPRRRPGRPAQRRSPCAGWR